MASYTISYTSTSVTFVVSGFNIGEYLRFFVRPEPATGEMIVNAVTIAPDTEPYTTTFGGLSPNASYATNVYVGADHINGVLIDYVVLGAQYFTTPSAPAIPDKWSWTDSNGDATVAQTQAAYTAITNQGSLSDFSYLVWNDLVNKANMVIAANGGSWNTAYGSLSATLMSRTDKAMTAQRFNALWYNLNQHTSTGLSAVSPGNKIYGSYFVALANAINNIV